MTQSRQIAQHAAPIVETFAQALGAALGDKLVALIVSGEGTHPDFVPGRSAIDSMALLSIVDAGALAAIRNAWKPAARKGLQPPVVLTPKALTDSLDAFPVEFLQVRETGVVVAGEFDLHSLAIERKDLRLQCERELRGMAFHARLAAVRFGDDARAIGGWLLAGSGKLDMLLQALEHLATSLSAGSPATRLARIGESTGVDCGPFQTLYELRSQKRPRVEVATLHQLEQTLSALVRWVDGFDEGAA